MPTRTARAAVDSRCCRAPSARARATRGRRFRHGGSTAGYPPVHLARRSRAGWDGTLAPWPWSRSTQSRCPRAPVRNWRSDSPAAHTRSTTSRVSSGSNCCVRSRAIAATSWSPSGVRGGLPGLGVGPGHRGPCRRTRQPGVDRGFAARIRGRDGRCRNRRQAVDPVARRHWSARCWPRYACRPGARRRHPCRSRGCSDRDQHPQGVRARQVMDMLNSDWPIGKVSVATLAAPTWWTRSRPPWTGSGGTGPTPLPGRHRSRDGPAAPDQLVRSPAGRRVAHRRPDDGQQARRRHDNTDHQVLAGRRHHALNRTGARTPGRSPRSTTENARRWPVPTPPSPRRWRRYSRPMCSSPSSKPCWRAGFGGRTPHHHQRGQKLGSSGFDNLPAGSQITVRQAAGKMIATSDNMATDLLIERLGTRAIEQALIDAGHHDPASMTPFPTMREIFSVGWGNPDVREQWKQAAGPADRAALLEQADARPYDPDPERTHSPAPPTARNGTAARRTSAAFMLVCSTMPSASGAGARHHVRGGRDRSGPHRGPHIGAKAGNLPGDLTFSWYRGRSGRSSLGGQFPAELAALPQPQRRRLDKTIIKQVFGLLPRQPPERAITNDGGRPPGGDRPPSQGLRGRPIRWAAAARSGSTVSRLGPPAKVNFASSPRPSPSQFSTSTVTSWPGPTSEEDLLRQCVLDPRWIVRRSGRAPSTGSNPAWPVEPWPCR